MSSSSDIAIAVRGLSKAYTIAHDQEKHITLAETLLSRLKNPFKRPQTETFWALKNISFDIKKGEVVGIIGRNGAGKSTLLKILSRITEPTAGEIDLYGRVGCLLEVGTGFHPELTGRENIYLNGAILGMTRREIAKQFDAIVDFAGIEAFLDTPVKRYSSGMYIRLAFAVAAHLNPEILVVDEVLAVGDSEFQKKCLGKMQDVANSGRTVLFVSHNMQSISLLCNRGVCLRGGRIETIGTAQEAIDSYLAEFRTSPRADSFSLKERPGTGEYRFTFVSGSKQLFGCDEEKQLDFCIERRKAAPGAAYVCAHLVNESGFVVAQCDSRLNGYWLKGGDIVRASLRIRSPWLKPGSYRVDAYVYTFASATPFIDKFDDACEFTVSPVLPYSHSASDDAVLFCPTLAEFRWSIQEDWDRGDIDLRRAPAAAVTCAPNRLTRQA